MNQMKNNVQLMGFVGKDPELLNFNGDKQMVKLTLATSDRYLSTGGEYKQDTQWHTAVAWGKTAEFIHKNVKKGNELAINGRLQYRSYENKDGKKQTIAEVVVNEFVKITKAKELPF